MERGRAWAPPPTCPFREPPTPCAIPTDLIMATTLFNSISPSVGDPRTYSITKEPILTSRCESDRRECRARTMNENSFKCAHSSCSNVLYKWQDGIGFVRIQLLFEWARGGGRKPRQGRACINERVRRALRWPRARVRAHTAAVRGRRTGMRLDPPARCQ